MDYMYNACSTTARRGALDWAPIFEAANRPVFEKLYESVKNGTETRKSLEFNSRSTYRQDLAKELKEIDDQEIWRAGSFVRLSSSACFKASSRLHVLISRSSFRQDRALSAPRLQAVRTSSVIVDFFGVVVFAFLLCLLLRQKHARALLSLDNNLSFPI